MSDRVKCAACGLAGHRYGRNEGLERYDPMACINQLRGLLEDERARWDDPDEVRAAVVPLLRLEAAQRLLEDEHRRYRLGWNPLPFDDFARQAVYAALGLGKDE